MTRKVNGGFVVVGLLCVFAIAACGRRSGDQQDARVPSDLDSLAFRPDSVQVRADVDSGNARYLEAWRVGSADLLAQLFAEDGALSRKDGTTLVGQDSITAVMGRVFSRYRLRNGAITTLALRIEGNRAYETGRYRLELVPVAGGGAAVDSGPYSQIWKYEGGQWKMWRNDGTPRG